ncbi:MAG: Ldh family oxidoreductase [Roseiflexaceae bacterium]|nr:Ldh family oxidoreductase [Roseiflexaceae bacterium]
MPIFASETLVHTAQLILSAAGTPPDLAEIVADSLVEANLVGHDSHGVIRLESYVALVRAGQVQPAAQPTIVQQSGATARVDAASGWGQPAARLATQLVSRLAIEHGVGAVTISNCNHIGRLGEYVASIAAQGLIGLAMCNAGPAVAPYGGARRTLGTNPFACAVPSGPDRDPILVDFATSGVAEGKLRMARAKGEMIAPGLLLNSAGQASTDPADFYAGGVLLPFGGHKGYGLSVMIELLGGALSGKAPAPLPEYDGGNGTLFLALSIGPFISVEQFIDQTRRFEDLLKETPPAAGSSEVMLPGEPEMRERRRRIRDGIPVPDQVWVGIQSLADELQIQI